MTTKAHENLQGTDLYATGSLRCAGAGSFSGNVTVKGTLTQVGAVTVTGNLQSADLYATGSLRSDGAASVSGDLTLKGAAGITGNTTITGCVIFGANGPSLSIGTAVPTAYAWPGSLYFRTANTGAAGSTISNKTLYMNTSASGAAGSTWSLLDALDAS